MNTVQEDTDKIFGYKTKN